MAFDKLHEECAVAGVLLHNDEAAGVIYNALLALQHRGQEGAGISVLDGTSIIKYKRTGLVSEIFNGDTLTKRLPRSHSAIGHCRYSTTGTNNNSNTQPFVAEYLTGRVALVHNGNIINSAPMKRELQARGVGFLGTSDSEVMANYIAVKTVECGDEIIGIKQAVKKFIGAFCLVIQTCTGKIVVVRDGHGFRPLCIGESENGIMVASESVALDSCGFDFIRDVEPGEMLVFENGKLVSSEIVIKGETKGMCIFEHVYFARSDAYIDGQSVYKARFSMGKQLAKEHAVDADCVVGVPDSGLDCAAGFAKESGLPLVVGFVKNRYIGRSFIYPTQTQREDAVRLKLNPLKTNVDGKRVVLVDDSIVRGTTSKKIIAVLRKAGAKEVHMRISAPPFTHSCFFGTDIDQVDQLIANQLTLEQIREEIGADSLGYISLEGLKSACKDSRIPFCTGCFDGNYNIDKDIIESYVNQEV